MALSPTDLDLAEWKWLQSHRGNSWPRLVSRKLAERSRLRPDEDILSVGERTLTVEEFASRVSSLACLLANEETDGPVAVLVGRNIDSAVSVMAVQWAGRCVVPINGADPRQRIDDVLRRLGECAVIDAAHNGSIINRRGMLKSLTNIPTEWVDPIAVPADQIALIIFTSGSTGHPKGVVRRGWQEDAAYASYLKSNHRPCRRVAFGPLQWLGGFSTFRNTMHGGCIRLIDPQEMNIEEVLDDLRSYRVEQFSSPPSMIHALANAAGESSRLEHVERIASIGESISARAIFDARRLSLAPVTVLASYGASEILGTAVAYGIGPDEPVPDGPIPMGRPVDGMARLVAVEGTDDPLFELVVHRWVSDGYWNDFELEQRRFGVDEDSNPFWKSGDLIRVDSNGTWFHAGRIDDMVKISGKLVEPSEATRILAQTAGVQQAVVLPRRVAEGRQQLVAHVEVAPGTRAESLREDLSRHLPAHLIPAVIVRHDQIPVTDRGKVDRQHLQQMVVTPWRSTTVIAPRSHAEEMVVFEACEFLAVQEISVDDNLWQLGLDSLGAIEFSEILSQRSGGTVSPNDFFGASTPAELAAIIEKGTSDPQGVAFTFHPDGDRPAIYAVTGAGGIALSFRHLAHQLGKVQPLVAFEQFGRFAGRQRDRTVAAASRRNIEELLCLGFPGPYVIVGHSWGGLVAHDMAVQLRNQGHDVALIILDTSAPSGRGRRRRPPALQRRIQSWPMHLAKLLYWRLAVAKGDLKDVFHLSDRSDRFYRYGLKASRKHTPTCVGGPMLIIQADGSNCSATWAFEPNRRVAQVEGGHNTLLQPPYIARVATEVADFVAEIRALETESPIDAQ